MSGKPPKIGKPPKKAEFCSPNVTTSESEIYDDSADDANYSGKDESVSSDSSNEEALSTMETNRENEDFEAMILSQSQRNTTEQLSYSPDYLKNLKAPKLRIVKISKTPVSKTPVSKTTVSKTPALKTAVSKTPINPPSKQIQPHITSKFKRNVNWRDTPGPSIDKAHIARSKNGVRLPQTGHFWTFSE